MNSGFLVKRTSENDKLKASTPSQDRLKKYLSWLDKQALSEHSKRAYRSRVSLFLAYLTENHAEFKNALSNPQDRDLAIRDYKIYLKRQLTMRPSSVNSTLTAIDHFYQFLGMDRSKIKREDLPQEAPRALDQEEQKRFLAATQHCRRKKDQAVALLLFYSGIRIGECVNLNVEDVPLNRKKGSVIVRSGKGERYREVPLNQKVRDALIAWLAERRTKFGESSGDPLFVNPQGTRLSPASIDRIVRKIGRSVGLDLSSHVLRHSCLTNLVRNGTDLVIVSEVGGHKRLETTKRYTLPNAGDKERAMEKLAE